jgi:hypothetical protein
MSAFKVKAFQRVLTLLDTIRTLDPNACWHLPKNVVDPRLRPQGQTMTTSRYLYTLLVGPLTAAQDLRTTCRNSGCRNPYHKSLIRAPRGGHVPPKLRTKTVLADLNSPVQIILDTIQDWDCFETPPPAQTLTNLLRLVQFQEPSMTVEQLTTVLSQEKITFPAKPQE